jgi:pyruvate dehydrogenase E2 component (dihydrolipoamide acetyltransferase)
MSDIYTVNLPDIGEGVVEGEVIQWLKNIGDPITQDEPVVIVMTDKATVELPAPKPGKLSKQYFTTGEKATLHKPLYDIELSTEVKKVLATPAMRRLAKEQGLDLAHVAGSGKEGRITSQDLPKPITTGLEEPLIGIRKLMAEKMAESKRSIPHFSFFEEVDVTRLVQMRENYKKKAAVEGVQVTYIPFLIRALSLTIQKFPIMNSFVDMAAKKILFHENHNIGIAMSTELGLIVPVMKEAQKMSLEEMIRAFEEIKSHAASNKLQPKDMKDSTITISNFGAFGNGGLWATPIINSPEVAILAVNKIQKRPHVKGEKLEICDMLNLSWTFDHRIIDGSLAAQISHHFATLVHNPAGLL